MIVTNAKEIKKDKNGQRILTKGRIAYCVVITDSIIPLLSTPQLFSGPDNPKIAVYCEDLNPHYNSLDPRQSAPQTASRSAQPLCRTHERNQQTDIHTLVQTTLFRL